MSCKLCGSTRAPVPQFRGIVRCEDCGLIYFPENVDTAELYSKDYFHGDEYQDYVADKSILQKNFLGRVDYLAGLKPSGKLFEIGCAYGFFLEVAKKRYDVKGVDISADAASYAKNTLGLDVRSGDFLSLPDEKGAYDLICLWDTIEHLSEPFQYLKKASEWLKPGGNLVLTTGDIGSLIARARGEKWRQIHPPTHLYYFDQNSIARALSTAGLELVDYRTVGQYRSYRSMMHGLFQLRSPRLKWIYSLGTLGGKLDFPLYLNTFDIMQATARKPG